MAILNYRGCGIGADAHTFQRRDKQRNQTKTNETEQFSSLFLPRPEMKVFQIRPPPADDNEAEGASAKVRIAVQWRSTTPALLQVENSRYTNTLFLFFRL